jgi:hypothetical protein
MNRSGSSRGDACQTVLCVLLLLELLSVLCLLLGPRGLLPDLPAEHVGSNPLAEFGVAVRASRSVVGPRAPRIRIAAALGCRSLAALRSTPCLRKRARVVGGSVRVSTDHCLRWGVCKDPQPGDRNPRCGQPGASARGSNGPRAQSLLSAASSHHTTLKHDCASSGRASPEV